MNGRCFSLAVMLITTPVLAHEEAFRDPNHDHSQSHGDGGCECHGRTGSRHHFGVQVPFWLNARASFYGSRVSNPGPNDGSGTRNRFYDDGYNRVDSTGSAVSPPAPALNSFRRTSFFGYRSASQVNNVTDAGTLALHSAAVTGGDYSRARSSSVRPGIELFYRYDWLGHERWGLSWEAGFSWQHADWTRRGTVGANINLLTDTYQLGGVFLDPSLAPYSGPFANSTPGIPVIGSTPTRSIADVAGTVTGRRDLDLDALMLRLGPAFDWRLHRRFDLGLLVGLALGVGFTELEYDDRISVNGFNFAQRGSSSDSDFWVGLYSALRATYHASEKTDVHLEVRHLWHEKLRHEGFGRSARIDLSDAPQLSIGVSRRW